LFDLNLVVQSKLRVLWQVLSVFGDGICHVILRVRMTSHMKVAGVEQMGVFVGGVFWGGVWFLFLVL